MFGKKLSIVDICSQDSVEDRDVSLTGDNNFICIETLMVQTKMLKFLHKNVS